MHLVPRCLAVLVFHAELTLCSSHGELLQYFAGGRTRRFVGGSCKCESEDELAYDGTSLLQTDFRVNTGQQTSDHRVSDANASLSQSINTKTPTFQTRSDPMHPAKIFGILGIISLIMALAVLMWTRSASEPRTAGVLLQGPQSRSPYATTKLMSMYDSGRPSATPLAGSPWHQTPHITPRPILPPTAGAAAAARQEVARHEVPVQMDMTNGPPSICPSLILPNTEARFVIAMDSLRLSSACQIDILGTSGRKLLHAAITLQPDGRHVLALASVGCQEDPRCIIHGPAAGSAKMEVSGRQGQPYGMLEPENAGVILTYSNQAAMVLDTAGLLEYRLAARTMDGKLLATASQAVSSSRGPGADPTWKLQVKPGADAVLIASCMLAVLLLRTGGTEAASPEPSASLLRPR